MNGSATLQILDPPTAPARDLPAVTKVEIEIGQAVADTVCAIRAAVDGCIRAGTFDLDPEIKAEGGTMIARVVMLQLDHAAGDDDFINKARDAGACVLRRRFAAVDVRLIDTWIADLFTIVRPIVKDERIFRAAWAH